MNRTPERCPPRHNVIDVALDPRLDEKSVRLDVNDLLETARVRVAPSEGEGAIPSRKVEDSLASEVFLEMIE